jgi:hypothetical protein
MSALRLEQAIDKLKNENLSPEAVRMIEFCKKSKRGIARPRMIKGKSDE